MDELVLKTFVIGALQNNCYLLYHQQSKKGFIVDLPAPFCTVSDFLKKENIEVVFSLLTHAHFDHIAGLGERAGVFYVHHHDVPLLYEPRLNGSAFFSSPLYIDQKPSVYSADQTLSFAGRTIQGIHTPGHTPGSVCLLFGDWLFSGDTLFYDSVGRTDIPLACFDTLIASIREKILTLPEATSVYPGHGPKTTIGREKKHNQFFK